MSVPPDPARLYATLCEYAQAHGWSREEPGSGWWLHSDREEALLGEVVDSCLTFDGIDTREEPAEASGVSADPEGAEADGVRTATPTGAEDVGSVPPLSPLAAAPPSPSLIEALDDPKEYSPAFQDEYRRLWLLEAEHSRVLLAAVDEAMALPHAEHEGPLCPMCGVLTRAKNARKTLAAARGETREEPT